MSFHESPSIKNSGGKLVAKAHHESQLHNQYKSTLRAPIQLSEIPSELKSLSEMSKYDDDSKKYLDTILKLMNGEEVKLYHGTNRDFSSFDMSKTRTELNSEYQGDGLFLSPSIQVAEKYANAGRNAGLDKSIIDKIKLKNKDAGKFLEDLYNKGDPVWDDYWPLFKDTGTSWEIGGVDPNNLSDIAMWIEGSKIKNIHVGHDVVNIFNMTPLRTPDYIIEEIEKIGVKPPKPRVVTVKLKTKNLLLTSDRDTAKSARKKGCGGVIFTGDDLVDNIPEVQLFNLEGVRISD